MTSQYLYTIICLGLGLLDVNPFPMEQSTSSWELYCTSSVQLNEGYASPVHKCNLFERITLFSIYKTIYFTLPKSKVNFHDFLLEFVEFDEENSGPKCGHLIEYLSLTWHAHEKLKDIR